MMDHRMAFASGDSKMVALCTYPKNMANELKMTKAAPTVLYGDSCNPRVMFAQIYFFLQICFERINNTYGNKIDEDSASIFHAVLENVRRDV